ncbi:YceI family protein [Nocardia sp. NPDC057353]|uniref:YceI family protein n=1 Tax=Nocardia sp. NPDC057353 TaxID=3346104 RepID=UPI0036350483
MTISTGAGLQAGVWRLDAANSQVGFTVRHMMISKVRGRFHGCTATLTSTDGTLDGSVVEATIEVASLDSGFRARDDAALSADYLDAATYPHFTFRSTEVRAKGGDYVVVGELTVRDVTRPVTLDVQYNGTVTDPFGKSRAAFSAQGEINRKDFGVTIDMPLDGGGFVVGDTIKFDFEVECVHADAV